MYDSLCLKDAGGIRPALVKGYSALDQKQLKQEYRKAAEHGYGK